MTVHRFAISLLRHALTGILVLVATLTAGAVEPVTVVATGGRIGYTFYTHPAGCTAFRQRTPHVLGGPVAEIQIGFMDWMYPSSSAETANATNDVTIDHAWLERASTGQIVPVTFGGSRQLVLPMNATAPYWLSDAIPSSVWTGAAPARDEVFWLHVKGSIPEGGKTPVGTPANFTGARFAAYPPANDSSPVDVAGPVATISGWSTRTEGLPVVFLGRYAGPGHLAVVGVGDSILNGSGDNTTAVIAGYGFFNRAALDANGKNAIATFNITRHGQTASSWVTPTRQSRQVHFLPFGNVMVEEYGTNDLGQAGGGSPTAILANVDKIWTAARDAGVQKIVRTTLMPRTASTDAWATFENQTPNSNWGEGATSRDAINSGFAAALSDGRIDVLIDSLAVVADPRDTGRWLTNGAQKYTTTDGTHVSPTGNALLAVPLRAALLSLTVDPEREDYARWSAAVNWAGADSSPEADPNGDGVNNLLAYALGLSPLESAPAGSLPAAALDTAAPDGPWLSLVYRKKPYAVDLAYAVESTADLASDWTSLEPDGVTIIDELVSADPDGDGAARLRRLRVRLTEADSRLFLRLRVTR